MRIGFPLLLALLLGIAGCDGGNSRAGQAAQGDGDPAAQEQVAANSAGAGAPASKEAASSGRSATDSPDSKATGEKVHPSWMTVEDSGVTFDVIAAWNAQNSGWNYNGYASGEITVVVPKGSRVEIDFVSQDASYPHSLVVIDDPRPEGSLPPQAGRDLAAFPRAYTINPTQGMGAGREGGMTFTADKAGDYLWFCGVPGHGTAGMWVAFDVRKGADEPFVRMKPGAKGRR